MNEKKLKRIEATFDAAKKVCQTLAPMTERAQRRILTYFTDLVNDPDTEMNMKHEGEILRQVHDVLGIK